MGAVVVEVLWLVETWVWGSQLEMEGWDWRTVTGHLEFCYRQGPVT